MGHLATRLIVERALIVAFEKRKLPLATVSLAILG